MPLKLTTLILLSSLLLNACAPAVFVAGATIGGAIIYDQRSLETINHDATIANDIQGMVDQQPEATQEKMRVIINVFNGVVLLAGQVPSASISRHLVQQTKKMPHVRRVYNELQVRPIISMKKRADDAWISGKIRTDLLLVKNLRSSQISVTTENGVAYLMGKVSRQQAALATAATRKVSGVRKVVALFEYVK